MSRLVSDRRAYSNEDPEGGFIHVGWCVRRTALRSFMNFRSLRCVFDMDAGSDEKSKRIEPE